MNAKIVSSVDNIDYDEIKAYRIVDAVKSVSCKEKYTVSNDGAKYKVALLDYGAKKTSFVSLLQGAARLRFSRMIPRLRR